MSQVSESNISNKRFSFKVLPFHFVEGLHPSQIYSRYVPNASADSIPMECFYFKFFFLQTIIYCFCCRLCSTKLLNIPQLIRQFHRICNRMAMHQLLIINLTKFSNNRTIPQMAEFREHGKVQIP